MNDTTWRADSDMMFTQITHGNYDDYNMAEAAVCSIYVPDRNISRGAISHVLGRLEKYYADKKKQDDGPSSADMQTLGESLQQAGREAFNNSINSSYERTEQNRWANHAILLADALAAWKRIHAELTK